MLRHLFIFSSLIISSLLLTSGSASAQTCKIRCGSTSDGRCIYKEVYEYDYVTVKPSFPGGDSKMICFINKTREYPSEAYKKRISGRVTCSFVINADGSVSDIKILKGVEPSLNKEALRIFRKMPVWSPGKIDNTPVPVRVIRSIHFRL